jgi:transposase
MAKTIRDRLEGITSYWTFGHASNASTEGFNNKIRWLIRQAYGFRDREYLKLKIYQLPEINCEKSL